MRSNLFLMVSALSFCALMAAIFFANLYMGRIVAAINQRRPDGQAISDLWFTPAKIVRTLREYRSLNAGGRLDLRYGTAITLAMASLASLFVSLQLAGRVAE